MKVVANIKLYIAQLLFPPANSGFPDVGLGDSGLISSRAPTQPGDSRNRLLAIIDVLSRCP